MKIYGIYLIEKVITGGNKRYAELMNGLSAKGHDVSVFINYKCIDFFSQCKTISVPIKLKKYRRINVQLKNQLKFFLKNKEITKADYCIVFGETDWKNIKLVKGYSNTKIIFCYRSDVIAENKIILKHEKISFKKKLFLVAEILLTRIREIDIAKKSDLITFQTENDKNNFLYRNKNSSKKCKIIRNDILRPRFSDELKNQNTSIQCKKLLFVGEYTPRKGFNFLLQSLIILHNKNIDFKCSVIARKTPNLEMLDQIKKNNLENKIIFLSPTNNVMPEMIKHDLLIVPSLFDSYPNVIMEAVHTGTPVIASNTSGMPYMLKHNELLFETANPQSIAEKIGKCIENKDYYLHLKTLCNERRSFFEFDWIQEWINILT